MSLAQIEMFGGGSPRGPIGEAMAGVGFDPGYYQPYFDEKGHPSVSIITGKETVKNKEGEVVFNSDGSLKTKPKKEQVLIRDLMLKGVNFTPVMNATTLRKDEWIRLETRVQTAARKRLKAWSDLRNSSTLGGFDGMANPILEWEAVSDPGEAVVDMDGMTEGKNFNPQFSLQGMPLPITHSDFFLSARFQAASRNKGIPADSIRAELAGRRVAETIEQTLIGTITGTTYGTSTDYAQTSKVYGYTNHPNRNTKTDMTVPTGSNGQTILDDVLTCIETLADDNFYGPFMVYISRDWQKWMNNTFSTAEPSAGSLKQRLLQIEEISDIRRLDYLTDTYTMLFVQMDEDVARAVNGMEITTVQWDAMGGMRKNFKVMGIQVPNLRADYNGNMGLLQATTA